MFFPKQKNPQDLSHLPTARAFLGEDASRVTQGTPRGYLDWADRSLCLRVVSPSYPAVPSPKKPTAARGCLAAISSHGTHASRTSPSLPTPFPSSCLQVCTPLPFTSFSSAQPAEQQESKGQPQTSRWIGWTLCSAGTSHDDWFWALSDLQRKGCVCDAPGLWLLTNSGSSWPLLKAAGGTGRLDL